MELSAVQESFERVAKRQKLSSSKSQELIDQFIREIERALASIIPDNDQKTILTGLRSKLQVIGSLNTLEALQTELNMNISKHPKVLDKMLHPDLSKACRNVDFDPHIVNQIIISHFYREGLFDIVDCLLREANEPEAISLRAHFQELHQVLDAMKCKNLGPALDWASANRERLRGSSSDVELNIHKLLFVDILQNGTRSDALNYAKTYLSPFASNHIKEIQKLMGSLLWVGKLHRSPYADLANPIHWEKLAEQITCAFFEFLGQPLRDPLNVVVSAGGQGLPTLLKLVSVMAGKKHEWQEMKQLPVPVELGKEFQFHSVFVCPVSRDQGSEENPAMLMPCGHVLCKQSIGKLSKGQTRNFKCPYCPRDASVVQCKQLHF